IRHAVQECCHLFLKALPGKTPAILPDRGRVPDDTLRVFDRRHQRLAGLGVEMEACSAVKHCLEGPALPVGDDRTAASLRFYRNHPEVLSSWKNQAAAVAVKLAEFLVADLTQKLHWRSRSGLELSGQRAYTHYQKAPPAAGKGVHGQIDSLVGLQPGNDQVVISPILTGVRGEEIRIHRRKNDPRLGLVIPADAVSHIFGVSHEEIYARGALPVEAAQPGRHGAQCRSLPQLAASKLEIISADVPQIAHRRVDVAGVNGPRWHSHALGNRVAARQDQVVTRQVERANGRWKQREVVSIGLRGPWEVVQERRLSNTAFDFWRHAAPLPQECEYIGGGDQVEQLQQDLLGAPHHRKPIVNESDSQGFDATRKDLRRASA